MEIETNLTTYEYLLFKMSYPYINTSTLIKIASTIKTPGVIQLMDINDYQIYIKQQNELEVYTLKMKENVRNTIMEYRKHKEINDEDINNVFNDFMATKKKHLFFRTYYLLPGHLFWKTIDTR